MNKKVQNLNLSKALEDYLETILELVRDQKVARIKDIAAAREVRPGSVIPAMRRLAELGLINYERREYIDLTPRGEREARRVYARHRLLTRFFQDILRMPRELALEDACAIEHNLSDIGMDHLVRFFEFMASCPDGERFRQRFRGCSLVHPDVPECALSCRGKAERGWRKGKELKSLRDLVPGESGRVARVTGGGAVRQRLLDMGIMPNVLIEMERVSPAGDPVWVRFQGSQVSLRGKEAATVLLYAE
jgi:DtxR family Mn-dependent transcriptional regulator